MQKQHGYRILILGSGGREHTLAWKVKQSPKCKKLFVAPGNGGTASIATNVNLDHKDLAAIGKFCKEEEIDMMIVGPEQPLVEGIADYFSRKTELNHIICVGPSAAGARLEGSKDFAKRFMGRHRIPTARHRTFSQENINEGYAYLRSHAMPVVLKADGLAAGKGVLICQTLDEAMEEFNGMLEGKFGAASSSVVVEQFLSGIEFSVFVLTDGHQYCLLPVAKDYKRIGEGDTGLNTGGMGSVSPVPFVDKEMMEKVRNRIIEPTIQGIREERIPYKGFVFFGLINVEGDPYVIEYNCRLGDPETEVVLPRLKSDLISLIEAMQRGNLSEIQVDIDPSFATTVVCSSQGYPGSYDTGIPIEMPDTQDSIIFHAGTRQNGKGLVTSGGRVCAVTSTGETLQQALNKSNETAESIQYDGKYFRKDIGFDLK